MYILYRAPHLDITVAERLYIEDNKISKIMSNNYVYKILDYKLVGLNST